MNLKTKKRINKNVVDDELKHKDYKNFLFIRSYLRHEMNRIQSKNHYFNLLTMIQNILNIADYHIFINLHVNNIKNNRNKYVSDEDGKRNKQQMRNYYCKRKNVLNNLI